MAINQDKLHEFLVKAMVDFGATFNAALIRIGDKLGLFKGLAAGGPQTAAELAKRTGTVERYVREWLSAQAAGGYVTTMPRQENFTSAKSKPLRWRTKAAPYSCRSVSSCARGGQGGGIAHGEIQDGRGNWLARAPLRAFCRHRAILSPGLRYKSCCGVDPCARRRRRKTKKRRACRRRRLWSGRIDHPDGEVLIPNSEFYWFRLPRQIDRDRQAARARCRSRRPHQV